MFKRKRIVELRNHSFLTSRDGVEWSKESTAENIIRINEKNPPEMSHSKRVGLLCEALTPERAVQEIKEYSGIQFDPYIARVFIEKVPGFKW